MEISKEIILERLFLYLKKSQALIISDPHIGFEDELNSRGVMLPKNGLRDLKAEITKTIIKLRENQFYVKSIIINGDLAHSFAKLSLKEKDALKEFIKFIQEIGDVSVILGNHDKVTKYLLEKDINISKKIIMGNVLITHGDKIDKESMQENIQTIIIGHEHPAIILSDGQKSEKYKCFLKGAYGNKDLIVMPSANTLIEGTNLLSEKLQSPYLKNIEKFRAYLIADNIYDFGRIDELRKKKVFV